MLLRDAHSVGQQHDDRIGYQIVDCVSVGLPLYIVELSAFVETRRELDLLSEFALRFISMGIKGSNEVSLLLGLPEQMVVRILAELVRSDLLAVKGRDQELCVTDAGNAALSLAGDNVRVNEQIGMQLDGIVRLPINYPRHLLDSSPGISRRGGLLVSPVPAKRPVPPEFPPDSCTNQLAKSYKHKKRGTTVLGVRDVSASHLRYINGTALVYKNKKSDEYRVAFSIDGRLSDEHENVYMSSESFKRQAVTSYLRSSEKDKGTGPRAIKKSVSDYISKSRKVKNKTTIGVKHASAAPIAGYVEDYFKLIPIVTSIDTLERAIRSARTSLCISTTVLQPVVLRDEFFEVLETKLRAGVEVFFLLEKSNTSLINDAAQEAVWVRLRQLEGSYTNFNLAILDKNVSNTLLVDTRVALYSSFPLLGYAGGKTRVFRDDWMVSVSLGGWIRSKESSLRRMARRSPPHGLAQGFAGDFL